MRSAGLQPMRPQQSLKPSEQVAGFAVHPDSALQALTVEFSVPAFQLALNQLLELESTLRMKYKITSNSQDYVRGAMHRYLQFMALKVKYPNTFLVPTIDIEMVWNSHLIRPQLYQDFCKEIGGSLIAHSLYASDLELALIDKAFEETQALWLKEFNEPYLSNKSTTKVAALETENKQESACQLSFTVQPKGRYIRGHFPRPAITHVQSRKLYHDPELLSVWNQFVASKANLYKPTNAMNLQLVHVLKDRIWYEIYISETKKQVPPELANSFSISKKLTLNKALQFRSIKAYERFLYLNAKHPATTMSHPTFSIDLAWHVHMSYPHEYAQDCQTIMHAFVDHLPWPELDEQIIQAAFDCTCATWKTEFALGMQDELKLSITNNDDIYT